MAERKALRFRLDRGGSLVFSVGLEWWRGLAQISVYSAVIVAVLWVMSKIELPDRGEAPSGNEKGKENE
jgi:hypothetical protein